MTSLIERLHSPGTPEYESATRIWNGAVTSRPSAAVRARNTADVGAAIRHARASDIPVAVRGGGHDWAGRSLIDGGLVIDMSLMNEVTVTSEVAVVSGGATVGDVVAAAEPRGLLPATGMLGDVGMVGLTLAGGYGPLNGLAGLALDNVLAARAVLADGSAVVVDARHEPDLFWALRGGGGNFGVVTEMSIRLHHISSVTAGVIMFPWADAATVIRGYDALVPALPDELTVQIGMLAAPHGDSVVYLAPVWSGEGDPSAWIERLGALGRPLMTEIAAMPHSAMLRLLNPFVEWGRHHEMRTRTLRVFNPGAVDALVRAGLTRTSPFSAIATHHFHGAAARVGLQDTAFGIREPHFLVEILAAWSPDDDPTPHRAWAESVYQDLAPHALEGGYPNLIGPGQADQARGAYGPNASRLAEVKSRYDPDRVFNATTLPGTP
jgi:FAD/FMN-containing dehydrogenase